MLNEMFKWKGYAERACLCELKRQNSIELN